jgi:hypothetical protein
MALLAISLAQGIHYLLYIISFHLFCLCIICVILFFICCNSVLLGFFWPFFVAAESQSCGNIICALRYTYTAEVSSDSYMYTMRTFKKYLAHSESFF